MNVKHILLAALWLVPACCGRACNIPVFRYALERWPADSCELVVFHDGKLTEPQQQQIREWESASTDQGGLANIKVIRCPLAGQPSPGDGRYDLLWDSLHDGSAAALPCVVVRTAIGGDQFVNHWRGSLAEAAQANLLESPLRAELGRRLLAGHSVVWLLLKSSDAQRTRQARELLQSRFATLASEVELPEGIGLPGSELHSEVPLLVKFSLLELDPADPREQFLIELLQGFRPRAVAADQPLAVPVFGRGRALEVIPADDLSPRLIGDLTLFLSGACSCQVKDQNPGFDLLISADWDTELFGRHGLRPPPKKSGDRVESPLRLTIPPGRN